MFESDGSLLGSLGTPSFGPVLALVVLASAALVVPAAVLFVVPAFLQVVVVAVVRPGAGRAEPRPPR